ncbi:type I-C CRISPR-associated protein Cas8c/Csd1 [Leptolyngbya sp. FACHB-541]|uniref:type I-C CRISPR-associated protein Cas8c/Csd1 n=1 Tax=Leptolyngbya sp. FACHB-541 TaxID=2692810 RepID=UPI0016853FB1|nr:type I-C CRISPR-associated protein Cas8c/Csd1 [Leptolyngbya sp. FACHB-541]MBD1998458.1 type I-C CRISPR-associated protein Cas8c/Csd1 [Leptolyngbya sp. FACHB-541]
MILTKLKEYADNRMKDDLPPPMYGKTNVAWFISLSPEGNYEGLVPLKTKEAKRGIAVVTPHIGRTVGVKPKLLADTGEYVLGVGRPTSKPERVADCHEQFKQLIQACAKATEEPTVKAIVRFLTTSEFDKAKVDLPKDFDPGDVVTFRVGDVVPADTGYKLQAVEAFWASYTSGESEEENNSNPVMTCLITGEEGIVEKRLPFLVKGLIGGQPSGTALVSANSPPFMSYGLQNSLTSPVSRDAAERFTKALNSLIADEQSRLYIGSTVYTFWTREETGFNPLALLNQPKLEEVENLLKSPFTAQQASSLDESKVNQFYALALTANNARAVVRDWLETTISNVQTNLQQWFQHQQIVDPYGAAPRFFSVYALAASVYRDASKEMQPTAPTTLIRNALHGDRIPEELLIKLVRRNRTEQEVTYPRTVLLKLIFSSHPTRKDMMTNMEQLNPNPNLEGNDLAAYSCGRLLAVLESIQRSAIGSVNASLTDRYYGTASSTPAVAFPPLLRGARAHFSKLRKTMPGTCRALEERVEEIMAPDRLPTFPKTLNLQQQGLFGLGYYHQRANDRATAKAKAEANKAAQVSASA